MDPINISPAVKVCMRLVLLKVGGGTMPVDVMLM